MAAIPPLEAFALDEFDGYWRTACNELDCDLALPASTHGASAKAHALLVGAQGAFAELLVRACDAVAGLTHEADFRRDAPCAVVEWAIGRRRGKDVVRASFVYDVDPNGLWSVDFLPSVGQRWWPVAICREDW